MMIDILVRPARSEHLLVFTGEATSDRLVTAVTGSGQIP